MTQFISNKIYQEKEGRGRERERGEGRERKGGDELHITQRL